jgi:hypothetical protein
VRPPHGALRSGARPRTLRDANRPLGRACLRSTRPDQARARAYRGPPVRCPFGGGVIGNTTGSGPVIEGSSPSPRAGRRDGIAVRSTTSRGLGYALLHAPYLVAQVACRSVTHAAPPSSSGLGRRPLTAVTWVQIPSGVRCLCNYHEGPGRHWPGLSCWHASRGVPGSPCEARIMGTAVHAAGRAHSDGASSGRTPPCRRSAVPSGGRLTRVPGSRCGCRFAGR